MKVAFLDRDGVINEEVNYLHKIEDFQYTKGCVDALRTLNENGYEIIIVTNQAGIAKGFYSKEQYQILTDWMLADLKNNGINILDVFHCPHHVDGVIQELSIDCECRKPKPGMILKAAVKYDISLENSFMIGDKISDISAAKNAGVGKYCLVRSGHYISHEPRDIAVYDNLSSFVEKYF